MGKPSVLAGKIHTLLVAKGWQCQVSRFTIRATEPALDDIAHIWLAGEAIHLSEGEISHVRPDRIIVPDFTSDAELARIEAAMAAVNLTRRVTLFTKFVDTLWGASDAARRALLDAESQERLEGFTLPKGTPNDRHVQQFLRIGEQKIADHWLLERTLNIDGSALAILADAGLGKSELLKWHEWRCGVRYQSAESQNAPMLPPVALRVPLRGLRTLSFDAIAHFLSHPANDDNLPALNRIDNGRFLLELLRLRRLILLLDGTDELMISSGKLEEGLRDLRRAVDDGARLAVSSRVGHLNSTRSISSIFGRHEIATIEPMEVESGRTLLVTYGASEKRADEVLKALQASKAHGIPLFLLLAYHVGLKDELDSAIASSKTKILLKLLGHYCARDEGRLGVSPDEQMVVLTEFAHWTQLYGCLSVAESLEYLGIDADEARSAIIKNPHALLTRTQDDKVVFRYQEFHLLFVAKAISEDWIRLGFGSIADELRGVKLDDMLVEYLARMLSVDDISRGWREASQLVDHRPYPLIRRNVLAIAIARLDDFCEGKSPFARSSCLAELLGGKEICDVQVSDVVIQQIDLDGWRLRRLSGAGSLLYCTNAVHCDYDESIHSLNTEGTEFPIAIDETAQLVRGAARLDAMIRPLRLRGVEGLAKMIGVKECHDPRGWSELRRLGVVDQERRFGGGEKFWVPTDVGSRMLTKFAFRGGATSMHELTAADSKLHSVLLALGER